MTPAIVRAIAVSARRRTRGSAALALLVSAASLLSLAAATPASARRLDVDVWTDRGDDGVYQPGEAMRIKVRTTADAYLLVYEIDSEGGVNLLYPWKRGQGRVEAAHTLRLPSEDSDLELAVEQKTGQGFVVAVASDRPFRDLPWFLRPYDPQAAAIGYDRDDSAPDARTAQDEPGFDQDGRVVGDPYVAMERIRRRVLDMATAEQDFGSDYSSYYVHEQVRYPRYLCNDCHRPNRWAWWDGFDPYYARCSVMDFRVNWGWSWGPSYWSGYNPYYYYVVRSDCPPRYTTWYDDRTRFSSWDGWDRWGQLWGGQLRRYKPEPVPVTYVPPPPRGQVWRGGATPPGYLPPDVRRQSGTPGGGGAAGWLQRDRGDGKPVWREGPRQRPDGPAPGAGRGGDAPDRQQGEPRWRDGKRGDTPQPGGGGGSSSDDSRPRWRGGDRPRDESPRVEPRREGARRQDPPRQDPPRQDPPRQDPPRQDPPRREPRQDNTPVWRQPPSPPPSDPPRWSPPAPKLEPGKGKGGKG